MKSIRDVIIKAERLDISHLTPFQGDLKKMNDSAVYKLKSEILNTGFAFSFTVWDNAGTILLIDGHQRHRALMELRKAGHEVPPMLCEFLDIKTIDEAKARVLQSISQYGKIDRIGFDEFVGNDFSYTELDERFDFPDFKLPSDQPEQETNNEPVDEQKNLLVIEFDSEDDLQIIFEEMQQRGYNCKISE